MKIISKTLIKLIIIVLLCGFSQNNAYAQDNNKLSKANTLFKAKRFAEAILIYEVLLEKDFNKSVLLKLARSHRQLNNVPEALEHFANLMAQPEVRSEHQLEYIELLIMNGDYKEAQKFLMDVPSTNNTIGEIFRLTTMINNNYSIDTLFHHVNLEDFAHNTSDNDENSPFFLDGNLVFTSDKPVFKKLKKKSGMTGRGFYKIWESKFSDSLFLAPKTYSDAVNASTKNSANAVFDTVHNEIFFTKNDNKKAHNSFYNMQLYSGQIKNGKVSKTKKISVNNSEYNFIHPSLSADGKTLLYVSNRRGEGGTDIFIAKRTKDGWSKGKNIGDIINTQENEGYPFLDKEGNLYFSSKGHSGLGGYDIYFSKKNDEGEWEKPLNLGRPFNSQHDDISIFFKEDGKTGAFTSSRNGSDDIFLFTIEEE